MLSERPIPISLGLAHCLDELQLTLFMVGYFRGTLRYHKCVTVGTVSSSKNCKSTASLSENTGKTNRKLECNLPIMNVTLKLYRTSEKRPITLGMPRAPMLL